MELKEIIKIKREELGLTLEEIGKIVGVSKTTVQRWESGEIKNLRRDKIGKLANALGVSPSLLLGDMPSEENTPDIFKIPGIIPVPSGKKIPVIGTIACGTPILAQENIEDYIETSPSDKATFALRCKGDSMAPRLLDGDIVLIHQQPTVENGETAAVLIGEEATLKRVYIRDGSITLAPENLNYEPIHLTGEDMSNVSILGKVVGYVRYF